MKLDPPGKVPDLRQLDSLATRRSWGRSLLGACLLVAVVGGPASLAGRAGQETGPATQRAWVTAFAAGDTPQKITFKQPPDAAVGVRVALSASAAPGLMVSFTSNTPQVCTVSQSTVTTMTAGVCTITASQGGDAHFTPAPEVARSFQVTTGQKTQTTTLRLPPDVMQRGVPAGVRVALSATAPDSALPVSLTSNTPAVCTVSESTALAVAAGMCTITASQGGSATYAPTAAARSYRVRTGQQTQTVMFTLPPELVQRGVPVGEPVTLSASAPNSGLAVSFTSATPQVCTVSGSTVLTLAASHGPCTISASQNGSATYAPANAEQSFPVKTGDKGQRITFTLPPEVKQGVPVGEPVTLSASAPNSGLAVSFTSATPQVCTVSGSTVLTLAASHGPCTISASQNGSATYAPANAEQSFPVKTGDKGQRITFTLPPEVKQGVPVGEPVTLSASASSRLPVSFTSATPRVCTISGSTVLTLATGGCTIIALQNGSVIYAAVSSQGPPFKVIRAGQTIIFDQPSDAKVGDRVTLVASASSGLPVSFTSTTHVCTVSQFIATAVTNGTCTIIASQSGDANYLPAQEARQSFQVKNGQTITFDQPPDAKVGDRVPLKASAASELQVSLTSTTPAICTVSESTATAGAAGTCTITASQAGNADYAAADDVRHSFRVTRAGQTVTFAQPPDVKIGDRVPLRASATSGLQVSLTSTTPAICTVSESTATAGAAGTCTITASQAGNADYAAAPDVRRSFRVTRARGQKISFAQPADTKVGSRSPCRRPPPRGCRCRSPPPPRPLHSSGSRPSLPWSSGRARSRPPRAATRTTGKPTTCATHSG